jgi:hypothetical protein
LKIVLDSIQDQVKKPVEKSKTLIKNKKPL